MALVWCGQLAGSGRLQKGIDFAEMALRADPLNDSLWALLTRLHGRRSAIQARHVLKRFAGALKAEDYPEGEIAALTKEIVSDSGPSLPSE